MSLLRSTLRAALALTLVTGCARETRPTDPSPGEVTFQSGSLSGTTVGRVGPPQTTSGPRATLTGLVGTFTNLSVSGPGLGSVATVYFTSAGNARWPGNIWQIQTDGTGLLRLFDDTASGIGPSIAPSGQRLLFWKPGPRVGTVGGHFESYLTERLPDGTTQRVATDTDAVRPVSWTPDEKAVIYPLLFEEPPFDAVVRRLALDTAVAHDLVPRLPGRGPPELTVGSVNGHTVVIYRNVEFGLNRFDLTTGLDTAYIPVADSESITSPDLSRDGRRLLFRVTRPAESGVVRSELRVADVNHPEAATTLPFRRGSRDAFNDEAHWMPDGSGIVVWASGPPYGEQLVLLDARGEFVRQLTSFPLGVARGFSVGPSTRASQVLIGEGGLLGSTASGIIFGQSQTGLTAVVGFQSDRPRSVTLKANTGLNSSSPALIYTLTADQLRTLRFINDPPAGNPMTVVDSASGPAGGAVINFDADKGTVSLVLPFAEGESRAATVTESGGTRIFRGTFLGVWKGGTNLAPRGATEVQLEVTTGRVEVTP